MALVTRLSRLFRADIHAVLDRIEEPELLLRQAVREMEEAVADDERRAGLLCQERDQLRQRQEAVRRVLATLEEELDVCFRAENEALARSLIRQRIEQQRLQGELAQQETSLGDALDELGRRREEQLPRLQSMRQKIALWSREMGDVRLPGQRPPSPVRDEEVEIAFLREKQRRYGS